MHIFPTMFWLALYTTLPFQSVINLLVGYNIESLSYLILPIYMVTLSLLSYKVLKFKPQKINKMSNLSFIIRIKK
ncbi:hypothetical protein FZ990_12200 [Clostridium perfringens]|nr:hypothetical protein [Clostridium perfringens]